MQVCLLTAMLTFHAVPLTSETGAHARRLGNIAEEMINEQKTNKAFTTRGKLASWLNISHSKVPCYRAGMSLLAACMQRLQTHNEKYIYIFFLLIGNPLQSSASTVQNTRVSQPNSNVQCQVAAWERTLPSVLSAANDAQ